MTTLITTVSVRILKYVLALLVNTSMLEINSRCAIRNFHLHEILLITLRPLVSVRNKYQKYFLRGKGDQCEELTNFIQCVCDIFGLIDLA